MRCTACGRELRRHTDRFRVVPLCDEHLDIMQAAAARKLERDAADWDAAWEGEERRRQAHNEEDSK